MISINQSSHEYKVGRKDGLENPQSEVTHAQMRFYIAKNRNGPKFITIYAAVNCENMLMEELEKALVEMDKVDSKQGKKDKKDKDSDADEMPEDVI